MDTPVSIGGGGGSGGGGSRIVLPANSGGHFMTPGHAINGRTVNFMLDTGATAGELLRSRMRLRIGLDYKQIPAHTA
jgi:aspartyl protease family protein